MVKPMVNAAVAKEEKSEKENDGAKNHEIKTESATKCKTSFIVNDSNM